MAERVGLEPTTDRLTADGSTIELPSNFNTGGTGVIRTHSGLKPLVLQTSAVLQLCSRPIGSLER